MNIYIYTLSFFLIGGEFLSLQKWDVRGAPSWTKTETKEWEVVFDMCSRESNELAVRKPEFQAWPCPMLWDFYLWVSVSTSVKRKARQTTSKLPSSSTILL